MAGLSETISATKQALTANDLQLAFRLVNSYLLENGLNLVSIPQLSTLLDELTSRAQDAASGLLPVKIAVLSGNHASAFLVQAIKCALAREGQVAIIWEGGYNGFAQEIIDPDSALYSFEPDIVVIGLTWHDITFPENPLLSNTECDELIRYHTDTFSSLWDTIEDRLGVPVIQHLYDKPPYSLLGVAERLMPGSEQTLVNRLNTRLLESSPGFVNWLDLDAIAAHIGYSNWSSARDYNSAKMPFALRHIPHYLSHFTAVYRGIVAAEKKCLVLDLDNTLWGGVIGEDGLDGIVIGAGTAQGEAYLSFCRYVKALKNRGVILAVNSKNAPEIAKRPFTMCEEIPLSLDDFALFVCNWNDKAENIRLISSELNLGLDAFVFVDDNAAECELVRRELPEVTTVELPEDASMFVAHLDKLHLFGTQEINTSDTTRTSSYKGLQRAKETQKRLTNIDDYLSSLNMHASIRPCADEHVARFAQMQSRTNQFNLTTRRYREDQIRDIIERSNTYWLSATLEDRFSEHGIVSTILLCIEDETIRIDDWLMSCRVFSRTLEQFIFNHLLTLSRDLRLKKIVGEYIPTERNGVVEDLYLRLGFTADGSDGRWWHYDVAERGGRQLSHIGTKEHV